MKSFANLILSSPFFEHFPEADRQGLAAHARMESVQAGYPILRENDRADVLYMLVVGKVRLSFDMPGTPFELGAPGSAKVLIRTRPGYRLVGNGRTLPLAPWRWRWKIANYLPLTGNGSKPTPKRSPSLACDSCRRFCGYSATGFAKPGSGSWRAATNRRPWPSGRCWTRAPRNSASPRHS